MWRKKIINIKYEYNGIKWCNNNENINEINGNGWKYLISIKYISNNRRK